MTPPDPIEFRRSGGDRRTDAPTIVHDRSERTLAEIAQRLEDITRLVSDWVWEADAAMRLTFVSERVFDALGRVPAQFIGRQLFDLGRFVDAKGNPVTDLTRDDFLVLEDGKAQEIVHFAHEETPLSIVLLVDSSESIFLRRRPRWILTFDFGSTGILYDCTINCTVDRYTSSTM